jgi:hypothetical protein
MHKFRILRFYNVRLKFFLKTIKFYDIKLEIDFYR